MAYVRNPVVYVPDLTNGRPIVDGKVYLLTSGTIPPMHDSTIDPLDLLTVTFVNEAGSTVEQPQPLYTSKGGCLYGNFPDAARQFMIAPQAYVFAAYNRIGELQYSAETSVSDYVETDALAAADSTVLVGGVDAGQLGQDFYLKKLFVPLLESNTAIQNSTILQSKIDEARSLYVGGSFGGGGRILQIPAGNFDFEGVEIKQGVSIEGAGIGRTVLSLFGDNKTGFYNKSTISGSFVDQVTYGRLSDMTIVPKVPATAVGQVMIDAIGFSRYTFENLYVAWCSGVVGIRATGGVLAGSGGPAQWYNTFKNIFVERPASFPAGGTGWLLGESDLAFEQITTWAIIGGRTSGSGSSAFGINIQGANTVAFILHTIEGCNVKIGGDSGRITRGVSFYPMYLEGSNNLTITANASGTAIFGDFITSYTFTDNSTSTQRHSNGSFKSNIVSAGSGVWDVVMENGASKRPKFRSLNTVPAFDLINSAGTDLSFNNGSASSASNSFFRLLRNNFADVLFSVGTGQITAGTDGAVNLGAASLRFNTVYAATGAINTSDERFKTKLLAIEDAEKLAAIEIKSNIKKYKMRDAVDAKGGDARTHFGVGAQTVMMIMEKNGLNPRDYAFFCHDSWDDIYEDVERVIDDKGNEIEPARKILRQSAGDRYGIRYDELSMFILSAI